MKLSDAILLGSTLLAPQADQQYSEETRSGCALGMAAIAAGCTFRTVANPQPLEPRTLRVEEVWGAWTLERMRRPCKCFLLIVPRKMRIKDIIAHLFDHHVVKKKNWTLEQLVDWVRKVEPAEAPKPRPQRPRLEVVWRRPPQTHGLRQSQKTDEWRVTSQLEPWRESARRLDLKDFEDVVRALVAKHGSRPRPKR